MGRKCYGMSGFSVLLGQIGFGVGSTATGGGEGGVGKETKGGKEKGKERERERGRARGERKKEEGRREVATAVG